jgi:hypothetical protein
MKTDNCTIRTDFTKYCYAVSKADNVTRPNQPITSKKQRQNTRSSIKPDSYLMGIVPIVAQV